MTETSVRIPSVLRNDRVIISLTAGTCILLLAVVLKNILLVPAGQLLSNMILYIIIYTSFLVTYPLVGETGTGSSTKTMIWAGVILLITLAIIAVYAI
jgi:uncharacterized RDD family membrane protein YckC